MKALLVFAVTLLMPAVGSAQYLTNDLAKSEAIDACMVPVWAKVKKLRREVTDCNNKQPMSAPIGEGNERHIYQACLGVYRANLQAERQILQNEGDACEAQAENMFKNKQRQEQVQREQEQVQRAAAEADRQRHEASQHSVNEAMRELSTARDRASAYNAKAAAAGSTRNVPLTSGEQRSLDAIRNQADANGLRPRYVPAEPTGYTVADTSALTSAVADLLGAEVQTVLKWGLNQTETGAYLLQTFETAEDYNAKYESFVTSLQYVRAAVNGTTTRDQDVSALKGTAGALSGFAFAGTPGISIQLDRVISGVAAGHQAGFQQLEQLIAAMDRPLAPAERARLSDPRLTIQAIFGPFLPLDRIHRMERVGIEGSRVYDSYNRGFLQVFGR
jgi:Skp family chaperone for outer membrane proteins